MSDKRWRVDVGDEGFFLEDMVTLQCWGLNKVYSHPEALPAMLNSDHAKAALVDEAVKALEDSYQHMHIRVHYGHYIYPKNGDSSEGKSAPLRFEDCHGGLCVDALAILTRLRDVPVHDTKGEA